MGKKNLDLIKNSSPDFYNKVLCLHKVAYSNKKYIDNEIKEYIKDEKETYYKPFQDKISENIESINERINSNKDSIESLSKKINERDEIIENKIRKNVYSEFITILGIFTAITFAIFGGMNLLSNLFQNIGSTQASLGQTLILAAIFGLIMWGIIELLFYWISKIKGITDSTKDTNKKWFNLIALGILMVILVCGVLLFFNIPVIKIVCTFIKSVR